MPVLIRGLPILIALVLSVYCLVECLQTPAIRCRNLAKPAWMIIIFLLPLIGSIAWLLAGRPSPRRDGSSALPGFNPSTSKSLLRTPKPTGRFLAPDDDPQFLAQLKKKNANKAEAEPQPSSSPQEKKQNLEKPVSAQQNPAGSESAPPESAGSSQAKSESRQSESDQQRQKSEPENNSNTNPPPNA